jgi:nicotinamide mononucleotide adenylyltransferase
MAADENWTADVPDPVVEVVRDIGGSERVRELWEGE